MWIGEWKTTALRHTGRRTNVADNKNEIIDPLSGAHIDAAQQKTVGHPFSDNPRMTCRDVDVYYGEKQAIYNVSLDIGKNEVIAMIGPSGCGKSTFLRCLNRMNDTIDICKVSGTIKLDETDIYDPAIDVVPLRAQVGMVFQKPNPFPKSIYDNIAYGPKIHGIANTRSETRLVERGQRSPGPAGNRPFRWPAAAIVHRPNHCRQSRSHPDGRALFGARPHCDINHRRADPRAQHPVYHCHRHPFDAAGLTGQPADGLFSFRAPDRSGANGSTLYAAASPVDAGLYHRPLRVMGSPIR